MKKLALLLAAVAASAVAAYGIQKPAFSGYIGDMPSVIAVNPGSNVWGQNLVHNRLSLGWEFAPHLRFDVSMRNRIMAGSAKMIDPKSTGEDNGWLDLSWNPVYGKNYLYNASLDRMFLTFEKNRLSVKLGRQRINWGQTLVWNPNDIFNTYSFFDFDYVERAGCDALRATFYHNETSFSELAVSYNHSSHFTAALLHHFNYRNFDYQIIAGYIQKEDVLLGGAWSGDFNGLNFRGELTYFLSIPNIKSKEMTLAASVGLDYMFASSLMLQSEVLYNKTFNSPAVAQPSSGIMGLYAVPMSAKNLSICPVNIFTQASYPLTPRLNGSLSAIYFVNIKTIYTGMSLTFSVSDNCDLSAFAQYFASLPKSSIGQMQVLMGFMRIKYSF